MSTHPRVTAADARIGTQIRHYRLLAGVSQERLAHNLGVTFQQLQKYESGTNRISAARLAQVARTLKVPFSALVDGADQGCSPDDPVRVLATTTHGIDVARAFARLDTQQRVLLAQVAEAMAR